MERVITTSFICPNCNVKHDIAESGIDECVKATAENVAYTDSFIDSFGYFCRCGERLDIAVEFIANVLDVKIIKEV